mmetsp:Transcript_3130/g.7399  ORF Transcript_3130/g.7399 Transcript_3130/m.7399 type:complete len:483 (+) Transcript_3130:174-1622(+)
MATSPSRRARSARASPYQKPKDARKEPHVPALDLLSNSPLLTPDPFPKIVIPMSPTSPKCTASYGPARHTRSHGASPSSSPFVLAEGRGISLASPTLVLERDRAVHDRVLTTGLGLRRTLSEDMHGKLGHLSLLSPDQIVSGGFRCSPSDPGSSDVIEDATPQVPHRQTESPMAVSTPKPHKCPWTEKSGVGVHSDTGGCGYQEDESLVVCGDDCALLGVFDGHGGVGAARFCREQLHAHVLAAPELLRGDTCGALHRGLLTTEQDLIEMQRDDCPALDSGGERCGMLSGATVVAMLLQGERFTVGWAGDCRAVLCRDGQAIALTQDHSLDVARERDRVASEGGTIENGRLCGCLSVARALGGVERATRCKLPGLSGVPEMCEHEILPVDEFVILASDGLWDVLSSEEAVAIARAELQAYNDATMASEKLVETALRRRTDDNVTALVVCLNAPPTQPSTRRRPRLSLQKRTPQGQPQNMSAL